MSLQKTNDVLRPEHLPVMLTSAGIFGWSIVKNKAPSMVPITNSNWVAIQPDFVGTADFVGVRNNSMNYMIGSKWFSNLSVEKWRIQLTTILFFFSVHCLLEEISLGFGLHLWWCVVLTNMLFHSTVVSSSLWAHISLFPTWTASGMQKNNCGGSVRASLLSWINSKAFLLPDSQKKQCWNIDGNGRYRFLKAHNVVT